MVLNSKKCKMMTITSDKTPIQSVSTSLHAHQLVLVDSYKYLGVELNNMLDWDQQWRRVQDKIKSIPFLLKKLKRIGFKEIKIKSIPFLLKKLQTFLSLRYSKTFMSALL